MTDLEREELTSTFLVLGAAPLLIYPCILMANVMSLAGEPGSPPWC